MMKFELNRLSAWVTFIGLSLGVPCLFMFGLFPTRYPLAMMVISLPTYLMRPGDVPEKIIMFALIMLVQIAFYVVFLFFISGLVARLIDRFLKWPIKIIVLLGILVMFIFTWRAPMWGGKGFVDPHPLQTMSFLLRKFPNPGI